MEYNSQVRKDIKVECKARVTENLGRCVGIQLLYLVPFLILGLIMSAVMFGSIFSFVQTMYASGYAAGYASNPNDQAAAMAILGLVGKLYGGMFLFILLMVVLDGPLQYGMMKFYMGLRRGENPTVGTLFHPFRSIKSIWTGIKMIFCIGFRSWLWMLVPTIICTILMMVGAVYAGLGTSYNDTANLTMGIVLLVISVVILLVAAIFISVKIQTYYAGWEIINENEGYGVWNATRDASVAFKGHYGKLLVFILSFIGWYLLLFAIVMVCEILIAIGGNIGGGGGLVISILAMIAMICIEVVFGAFIGAYYYTSFFGMYEYFRGQMPAPAMMGGNMSMASQPQQFAPQQPVQMPQPPVQTPEPPVQTPEQQPAPQEPTDEGGSDDSNPQE